MACMAPSELPDLRLIRGTMLIWGQCKGTGPSLHTGLGRKTNTAEEIFLSSKVLRKT